MSGRWAAWHGLGGVCYAPRVSNVVGWGILGVFEGRELYMCLRERHLRDKMCARKHTEWACG